MRSRNSLLIGAVLIAALSRVIPAGAQTPLCDGREAAAILGEVMALRHLAGLPERGAA